MDYAWKYYIDDLRAGKSQITITEDERAGAGAICERMAEDTRRSLQSVIRTILVNHRQQGSQANALADDVMRQHTAYCQSLADDELLKRRHNAIVYRYMIKTALHNKAVAGKLGVSRDTIANDLRAGRNELLVILFGVPALPDLKEGDAVKCLLESWRLLQYSQQITARFDWQEWENERIRDVEKTMRALQSVGKALELYEEYAAGCQSSNEPAARSLYTVRAAYIDTDRKTIDDIATETKCSTDTVYGDLKKAREHLTELLEYMAACDKGG